MIISATKKIADIIKLSQNENPFGASPQALKALSENYETISRYPGILHEALIAKLADMYRGTPENIVISAGSVELIDMIIKTFVGVDENIVTSDLTFVAYRFLAKVNGRECRTAKTFRYAVSPMRLLTLCDEKTRVVFIANPNNPTGTIISHAALRKFLTRLPADVIAVIDEAYAEYVTAREYPDSLELQRHFPNLIILRTFSKIYGLAGLRIGYAIARPDLVQTLRQNRTPFSVNGLAEVAANAALDDQDFARECAGINERERVFLYDELRNMGFKTVPSQGNFMFVKFSSAKEKLRFLVSLKADGILARDLAPFGAKMGLRISVGRPEENRKLVASLRQLRLKSVQRENTRQL